MFFALPPLGKPDPAQPRPLEGEDLRSRIRQKTGTNNCWYACVNLFRDRWKAPNINENFRLRQFEKLMSSRIKAISQIQQEFPFHGLLHLSFMQNLLSKSKADLNDPEAVSILYNIFQQTNFDIMPLIKCFMEQDQHVILFRFICQKYMDAINRINVDTIEKVENLYEIEIKYPSTIIHRELETYLRYVCALLYGLKIADWQPQMPIENLIATLKKNGPLLVRGSFGRSNYSEKAKETGYRIENRMVYGWDRSDRSPHFMPHAILVVGAQRFPQRNIVYYLDPLDESDPNEPQKQKIYAISYETLTNCRNIGSNLGRYNFKQLVCKSEGYAMYKGEQGYEAPFNSIEF